MTGEGTIEQVLSGEKRWAVVCGDCLDVLPRISVDATITDPPYGVDLGKCGDSRGGAHGMRHEGYGFADTYEHFVGNIVLRLNAALDRSRRGLVWTGPHIHEQRKPDVIGGVYCPAGAGRHCWGFKNFLPVLLYGKAPALHLGAKVPTVLESSELPEPASKEHPVPKPVGWMLWSVWLASLPGEVILDPFCGSGTTLVAGLRLGRRVVGIDIDQRWVDLSRSRLRAEESGSTLQASRAGQVPLFGVGT